MPAAKRRMPTTQELLRDSWRLTPDRLAAHLTRNDEVIQSFGSEDAEGFQMAGPYRRPKHVQYLGKTIAQTVARGNGRLIINQPPQTGKSQLVSKWTPVWAQHITAGRVRILLGAYSHDFAAGWGREVRNTIEKYSAELGVEVSQDSSAANTWHTTAGGSMLTAGRSGVFTGKPGDIIIIDDPFKDFKEAHSPGTRRDVWDWWQSVVRTRFQPGTTVIVIQTRWHEEDLTGKLMSQPGWQRWKHIRLPAICDDEVGDPLGRMLGESIWPERFPADGGDDSYAATRVDVGAYKWAGLYQQLPAPLEGELFKRGNWVDVDVAPLGLQLVRRWDLAATEGDGDWTVGVLMGRDPRDGRVYVIDVVREQVGPAGVETLLQMTAKRDRTKYGGQVRIRIEQEPGSSGKIVADNFVRVVLAGHPASAATSSGDKELRAQPFAAQQAIKNVALVKQEGKAGEFVTPEWHGEFVEEHAVFPNGGHDDQVDAASAAFADLLGMAAVKKKAAAASAAAQKLPPKPVLGRRR